MGFLDKVKFWKKKDDFDFDDAVSKQSALPADDLGLNQPTGLEETSPFAQDAQQAGLSTPTMQTPTPPLEVEPTKSTPTGSPLRDVDLLNSKLDTIKALLTSLDQRTANIERNLGQEQKQKLW